MCFISTHRGGRVEVVSTFGTMVFRCESLIRACCGSLLDRVIVPGDTPEDKNRKLFMTLALPVMGMAATTHAIGDFKNVVDHLWTIISTFYLIAACALFFFYVVRTKTASKRLCETFVVLTGIFFVIPADLHAVRQMGLRAWTFWVLLLDVTLVLKLSSTAAAITIITALAWLAAVELNLAHDFGLFDDPWEGDRTSGDACSCPNPPCSTSTVSNSFLNIASLSVVFLLDYMITRGFAKQLRLEKAKIAASIDVAQVVASCLAQFDLDSAEAVLTEQKDNMPDELSQSLGTILTNLRGYRPYLPQSMLRDLDSESSEDPISPPGEGQNDPHAGIVFTDIKGSTALWEACSEGMAKSMSIHNRVIRNLISEHGGYEVKTIGDAFMVAFATAEQAVLFGLDVQRDIHEAEWPEQLLEHRGCGVEDGWPGLQLRIGVMFGPVLLEFNTLTDRMDYFGPTVNRAACLESIGTAGTVAVLDEVYVSESLALKLPHVHIADLGHKELKGVPGLFHVRGIVHAPLAPYLGLAARTPTARQLTVTADDDAESFSITSSARSKVLQAAMTSLSRGAVSRLGELVDPKRCSVAHVQQVVPTTTDEDWAGAVQWVHTVMTWLRRSEGSVVTVSGMSILASWGLVGSSSMHTMKAFRFAAFAQQETVPLLSAACGISSGIVSGGPVGDWEARFLAYAGSCINISFGLGLLAQRLEASVLYGTERQATEVDTSLRAALRPVGRVGTQADRMVVAFEVCGLRAFGAVFSREPVAVDSEDWGWSNAYADLFYAGKTSTILHEAESRGDRVLIRSCKLHMFETKQQ